jgi:hypothetical protein
MLTTWQEAQQHLVSLPDDNPHLVLIMLHYFYHFDYDDENRGDTPAILLNLKIFMLADKYMVEPLKTLAKDKFTRRAQMDWDKDFFAQAITVVYDMENKRDAQGLKDVILQIVAEHASELLVEGIGSSFREKVLATPSFLLDYTTKVTKIIPPPVVLSVSSGDAWFKCSQPQCSSKNALFKIKAEEDGLYESILCPGNCFKDDYYVRAHNLDWWKTNRLLASSD